MLIVLIISGSLFTRFLKFYITKILILDALRRQVSYVLMGKEAHLLKVKTRIPTFNRNTKFMLIELRISGSFFTFLKFYITKILILKVLSR